MHVFGKTPGSVKVGLSPWVGIGGDDMYVDVDWIILSE